MRILHVITSLNIGGAERLMLDLLPSIRKHGFVVELAVLNGTRTFLFDQLEKEGIMIHVLGHGSVYHPRSILKLTKLISNFDIIHSHNFASQLYVAVAKVISSRRCKLVTTEHSTSNRRRSKWWMKWLDVWMYRRYDRIIAISDRTSSNLAEYIHSSSSISVIYNGVNIQSIIDAPLTNLCKEFDIPENSFILMQVAGFRIQKDQDTVIKALMFLPSDVHLVLVGDGERKPICEGLAKQLGLENQVHFAGIRSDVHSLLKSANVSIMSSHWEGFGLAAVEAMCLGMPTIASNVPGLKEVVSHYGVLFEHQNAELLSQIILELKNDKTYRENKSSSCRFRSNEFDISKMISGYVNIYNDLI